MHIINHVWVYKELPDDWRHKVILPFWKYKGNKLICGSHRGIMLLSIQGKLFTQILLNRTLPSVHSMHLPEQAGLMPRCSTTDNISALQLIIEKFREYCKDHHLFIAFIDLKTTFNIVDHQSLSSSLRNTGVSDKITSLPSKLCDGAECCLNQWQRILLVVCQEWSQIRLCGCT